MSRTLVITVGDTPFEFAIENTPIAELWLEKMACRHSWPLDDAQRFYHFNSYHDEQARAAQLIKQSIKTINKHKHIIKRTFKSVYDQDTLNYLHNIFERYHGMLDKQDHDFWLGAPSEVRSALSNLNVAVHRCEKLPYQKPEFVCTWFGMPKTHTLPLELQQKFGKLGHEFGAVYLNYVEIGKTALHLARDNDQYIADEMFKPFNYYSADFIVTLHSSDAKQLEKDLHSISTYYSSHQDFFQTHGITGPNDVRLLPLHFKVAQLKYDPSERSAIIRTIAKKQVIQDIKIT